MSRVLDYSGDLRRLADLAGQPDRVDEVLGRALASLADLVPHDLAAILDLEGERLAVRVAHGPLVSERVRRHSIPVDEYPAVRRAIETRRAVVLEDHDHDHETGEGDPYDAVLDLPHGHSCMVVPLHAADRTLGIMTFDRTVCGIYDRETVALAEIYGQIIALAMLYAEQARLLERYRASLIEQQRFANEATGRDPAGAWLEQTRSPAMLDLVRQAKLVAAADSAVLVLGETGSGKEVLARAIHAWSSRREAPFVTVNCAALPRDLVESELFGHVRGAFTGAVRDRRGRFLTANGGTLLLDEVGDLPLAAQAKLLRVLQEGAFQPVGADHTVKVDVRIMAATHVDLEAAVREGSFREDLYFRLAVFPLNVPPLRHRGEDIVPLAEHLLDRLARRTGRGPWQLAQGAKRALQQRTWPGNVRELVNALERAAILRPHGTLDVPHVAEPGTAPVLGAGRRSLPQGATADRTAAGRPRDATAAPLPDGEPIASLREVERAHIAAVLARTGGKIYGPDGAAALLGLKPTTLQSRLKKLGLK